MPGEKTPSIKILLHYEKSHNIPYACGVYSDDCKRRVLEDCEIHAVLSKDFFFHHHFTVIV